MYPDNLISFTLFGEPVTINLYGICIALALLAALLVFHFYTSFKKINSKVQDFGYITAICAMAGGFLFAKLFQAVYDCSRTARSISPMRASPLWAALSAARWSLSGLFPALGLLILKRTRRA